MNQKLDKLFKLTEHNTNVKTEITAGVTTFMTMAYILAVNPAILGDAGIDPVAVLLATALSAFVGTACMAFMANLPFALAAGMGLNAYLAYTVILGQGISWQAALLAVFIEGIIFIILSLTSVREKIFNIIPMDLKRGVSAGIGIFIAFIGLQNAGLCVDASTLVTIVDFTENFHTSGICALLTVVGFLIMATLYIRRVRGSILLGILITWILGMLCQMTGIYVPDPAQGMYSMFPSGIISFDYSALGKTFGQCFHVDFSAINIGDYLLIIFALLFIDIFDTLGALIGLGAKAGMIDENGRMHNTKQALLADAIATSAGAVLGTSTTTTFAESSAGIAVGGKTGLTALTTGVLFLAATLFSPLFIAIPSFATAPALIMVGFMVFEVVTEIRFAQDNWGEAIPAYLCVIAMPLFYSISTGIAIGIISYVVINVLTGKAGRINGVMYVLAVLFVLKYIFL